MIVSGVHKYDHTPGTTTFIAISSEVRPRYLRPTAKYLSQHPNPGAPSASPRDPCFLPVLSNVRMTNHPGSPSLMFCHPPCRRRGKFPRRYTRCTSKPSGDPPSGPHLEGRPPSLLVLPILRNIFNARHLTAVVHRHCGIGLAQTSCHSPCRDGQQLGRFPLPRSLLRSGPHEGRRVTFHGVCHQPQRRHCRIDMDLVMFEYGLCIAVPLFSLGRW